MNRRKRYARISSSSDWESTHGSSPVVNNNISRPSENSDTSYADGDPDRWIKNRIVEASDSSDDAAEDNDEGAYRIVKNNIIDDDDEDDDGPSSSVPDHPVNGTENLDDDVFDADDDAKMATAPNSPVKNNPVNDKDKQHGRSSSPVLNDRMDGLSADERTSQSIQEAIRLSLQRLSQELQHDEADDVLDSDKPSSDERVSDEPVSDEPVSDDHTSDSDYRPSEEYIANSIYQQNNPYKPGHPHVYMREAEPIETVRKHASSSRYESPDNKRYKLSSGAAEAPRRVKLERPISFDDSDEDDTDEEMSAYKNMHDFSDESSFDEEQLNSPHMTEPIASSSHVKKEIKPSVMQTPKPLFKEDGKGIDPMYMRPTTEKVKKKLGQKASETLHREQALTADRLKDLHSSLVARPAEDAKAEDPEGLRVPLMQHQKHALIWLLWREAQKPRGGVLADDMGLGKTLTMISLVMCAKAISAASGDDEAEDWKNCARSTRFLGGTLVIAPASLVSQWDVEVRDRCEGHCLNVARHHGSDREGSAKRLAKKDIVFTSYNIVSREYNTGKGVLFKIHWRRVILDEAHTIRNHKSQTCASVCNLHTNIRWALTGTPIHNKEMDLYAILKFLQCSPFDDVRVWKRWVDNKDLAGHERLATVMKTLMLRRTKEELQATGSMPPLPVKTVHAIDIRLDPEERLVYDKVMVFSRTLFAQFLAQRKEKAEAFEYGAGRYVHSSWQKTYKDKRTPFTKAQNNLLSMHADVKAHVILVLILRLRQVCSHPSLIHAMLDQEDFGPDGTLPVGASDFDVMAKINKLNISGEIDSDDEEDDGDIGVDERVTENLLTTDNPVFDIHRKSSKMRAVMSKLEEIVKKGDKVVVVSQWTSVLDIVAAELGAIEDAAYRMFTGKIPVKDRQDIMDAFNSDRNDPNVLLLSLTSGGVGLNLVGANHLLLIDMHWNPQLENQAEDRIYRFGQTKDVHIYKYVCSDTIEERIQALQAVKMRIATDILSGFGKVGGSKLTIDDLKSLFSV